MSDLALSTRARLAINRILNVVGFELSTTRAMESETARLNKLKSKGHWLSPLYSEPIQFNAAKHLLFLEQVCLPYKTEYECLPQSAHKNGNGFYLENGWFGPVDAEALYCIIRRHQPDNIIEIGSGFSTRLMRRAINDGSLHTHLLSVDPQPRVDIHSFADEFIDLPIEDVEVARLTESLSENDILFIDSSHIAKTGSDVLYLLMEILPRLKRGVLVHIHDVFLPFDYPEEFVLVERWGWTEQYFVHAFLSYNDAFEIIWPARYMWEYYTDDILQSFPSAKKCSSPSSLWLKKLQ